MILHGVLQIRATEIVLSDADIATTLVDFIVRNNISNLVVGISNRSALTRAFRNPDVPTNLSKTAPDFCTMHAISKGKVQIVKTASRSVTPASSTFSSKPPVQSAWDRGISSAQKHIVLMEPLAYSELAMNMLFAKHL
ncbi:hypothetical protein AgCh_013377 [Apium graveolens]